MMKRSSWNFIYNIVVTKIPTPNAIPKLNNVPMRMYSVSFLSFESFKSPKRNTDLAANRKPIASQCLVSINVKTNNLSNMPMYLPALLSDSSLFVLIALDQLDKSTFMIILET